MSNSNILLARGVPESIAIFNIWHLLLFIFIFCEFLLAQEKKKMDSQVIDGSALESLQASVYAW